MPYTQDEIDLVVQTFREMVRQGVKEAKEALQDEMSIYIILNNVHFAKTKSVSWDGIAEKLLGRFYEGKMPYITVLGEEIADFYRYERDKLTEEEQDFFKVVDTPEGRSTYWLVYFD
jgi:predicted nucleic acid-binding protein